MAAAEGRTIVIGAGLGGLLTSAYLATRGRPVLVLEALDFPGGRFTHLDYDGFAVPTGAFHAIPGGVSGPLYRCLRLVGIHPELAVPDPLFRVRLGDRLYAFDVTRGSVPRRPLGEAIGLRSKLGLFVGLAGVLVGSRLGPEVTVEEAARRIAGTDAAVRLFDRFTKFSLGVPANEASVLEIVRSLRVQRFGREGFLKQGNRAMIEALVARIRAGGGELQTRRPVETIVVESGRAVGVRTADGEHVPAQQVVCNAGARTTARLLGDAAPPDLTARLARSIPAWGAAHSVRAQRKLHDHDSIEIPLDLDHIAGIVPLSNLCPALCPEGWHYSIAYQWLDRGVDVAEQLDEGRADLHRYLGEDIEVFNSAVYRGSHPAAAVAQRVGQHGARRFPTEVQGIRGLYMVGHDVAGYGIAAEVIGHSCLRLWRKLA